jgi:hypothetical protein
MRWVYSRRHEAATREPVPDQTAQICSIGLLFLSFCHLE